MKRLLLFLLLFLPNILGAQTITSEKAQKVANNYLKQLKAEAVSSKALQYAGNIELVEVKKQLIEDKQETLYYIFKPVENKQLSIEKNLASQVESANNTGFIIVSGNKSVEPILAYSLNSPIHENPEERSPEFNYWMQQYEQQITDAYQLKIKADDAIKSKWQKLEKGEQLAISKSSQAAVGPLISTSWDQGNPYNEQCPSSFFGGKAVTGCVATAMAQVMKYHNHPPQGEGYHSYSSNQYGTLSADYGSTAYGWGSMSNQPSSSNPSIAKLMYHCGVSVNMNYSPQSSGAYVIEGDAENCSEKAFKEYFGYDTNTVSGIRRQSYSDSQWTNIIRGELEDNQPVLYAGFGNGGGHAFVCDGVDNSNLFHFNWGWGGYEDGYFQLNALNPNLGGTGAGNGGYNSGQQAVIGVKPAYGNNNGGGTPTPPNSEDDSFYGLALFSQLDVSQSPLDFNQAFEVYAEIGNYGTTTVSGTIAVLLYDEAGNQIATIDPKNTSIQGGFYETYTFSTAGLTAVPGSYSLGVYYRASDGDWRLIDKGEFFNPGGIEITGIDNNIRVYSQFEINPNPVEQAQPFAIQVDIANFANSGSFSGNISVDLYTLDGDYISELDVVNTTLNAQTFNTFTFQNPGLTQVDPGTYLLVAWNQPNGGDWQIVGGTDDNKNPIYLNIATPGIQADAYENNNSSAAAFEATPSFSGNNGVFQTQNANIHNSDDIDYFVIDLPSGAEYTVTAEVKDSYNSGNTYTNDMLFAYKIDNGEWSNTFDSSMPNLTLSGGEKVYFAVASYFVGKTGTYQFIAEVNGEAYTNAETVLLENITVSPNPTNGVVFLDNLPNKATSAKIYNINGQLIANNNIENANNRNKINLGDLTAGVYFIQVENGEGKILAREKVVKN